MGRTGWLVMTSLAVGACGIATPTSTKACLQDGGCVGLGEVCVDSRCVPKFLGVASLLARRWVYFDSAGAPGNEITFGSESTNSAIALPNGSFVIGARAGAGTGLQQVIPPDL